MKWNTMCNGDTVRSLELGNGLITAKVLLTSYGLFEIELNGQSIGDYPSLASAMEDVERRIRDGFEQIRKEIEA